MAALWSNLDDTLAWPHKRNLSSPPRNAVLGDLRKVRDVGKWLLQGDQTLPQMICRQDVVRCELLVG